MSPSLGPLLLQPWSLFVLPSLPSSLLPKSPSPRPPPSTSPSVYLPQSTDHYPLPRARRIHYSCRSSRLSTASRSFLHAYSLLFSILHAPCPLPGSSFSSRALARGPLSLRFTRRAASRRPPLLAVPRHRLLQPRYTLALRRFLHSSSRILSVSFLPSLTLFHSPPPRSLRASLRAVGGFFLRFLGGPRVYSLLRPLLRRILSLLFEERFYERASSSGLFHSIDFHVYIHPPHHAPFRRVPRQQQGCSFSRAVADGVLILCRKVVRNPPGPLCQAPHDINFEILFGPPSPPSSSLRSTSRAPRASFSPRRSLRASPFLSCGRLLLHSHPLFLPFIPSSLSSRPCELRWLFLSLESLPRPREATKISRIMKRTVDGTSIVALFIDECWKRRWG